jgi:hypothetical protein
MLTIEYRVNGQLVGYTNIHNIGTLPDNRTRYAFRHFSADKLATQSGEVLYIRKQGFERLVKKVLSKIKKE